MFVFNNSLDLKKCSLEFLHSSETVFYKTAKIKLALYIILISVIKILEFITLREFFVIEANDDLDLLILFYRLEIHFHFLNLIFVSLFQNLKC